MFITTMNTLFAVIHCSIKISQRQKSAICQYKEIHGAPDHGFYRKFDTHHAAAGCNANIFDGKGENISRSQIVKERWTGGRIDLPFIIFL